MTLQNRILSLGLVLAVSVGSMSFVQAQESEPSAEAKQRTLAEMDKALREVERAHKQMAELRAQLQLARLTSESKKTDPRRVPIVAANIHTTARGALYRIVVEQKIKAEHEAARKAAANKKNTTRTLPGSLEMQRNMLETMHVLLREVRELRTLVESLRPKVNKSGR